MKPTGTSSCLRPGEISIEFFTKFNKCEMIQLKCQQFSPRLRNAGCKKTTEISGKRNSRPTYD